MHRFILAISIVLSLVIGSTVGLLVWQIASASHALAYLGTADPAIGYAFYAGIDQVLANGDGSALERVVADGFVDHAGIVPVDRSAEELIAQFSELGQSAPGTRIVVNGLSVAPGALVVSIAPLAPMGMAVANVPLTINPLGGGYDILRVRNGKVTERWSNWLPTVTTHTYDATLTIEAGFSVAIRLDRLELPNGGRAQMRIKRQSVVVVETGRLQLRLSWTDTSGNPQSSVVLLDAGEAHMFTDDARVDVKNDGAEPARFLRYSTRRVLAGEPWPLAMSGEASSTRLWLGTLPEQAGGYWRISIGTMHLPARAGGVLDVRDESTLLLLGSQGTTHLDTNDGDIYELSPLSAGEVASVAGVKSVGVRNDDDSAVWVIAIELVDTAAGTPVPY
jgi:hypothetical protein